MRIVVMSDSHGNSMNVKKILEAQKDADLFLHLGDGERECRDVTAKMPEIDFRFVRGNGDFDASIDAYQQFDAQGYSIFMTHGHMYNVKFSMNELLYAAQGRGADIVLYGHTHVPHTEYVDGMYILNPGSCSSHGSGATYAVLDITSAGVVPVVIELHPSNR